MISKALVRGAYQRKLEELAAIPGVTQLTVVVPPYWREPRAESIKLEKIFTRGYDLVVEPMALNGRYHTHFYPGLARLMSRLKPDLVHADEESYNLATVQSIRLARQHGARAVFYNWANIYKNYPPPFNFFERFTFKNAAGALTGNSEGEAILRQKGFNKALVVCPQFGVDPAIFHRTTPPPNFARPDTFTIGYVGRLVPEKGLTLLLEAAARLRGDWRITLIGEGDQKPELEALAEKLKISKRVEFVPSVSSLKIPAYMSAMDVFVLPSLTRPNWKEQFGRVLVEAMACGVPVVGSSSGEIPNVIGDAGLVFPENNVNTLVVLLQSLMDDRAQRQFLVEKGLARVEAHFTQAQVARKHFELYQMALR